MAKKPHRHAPRRGLNRYDRRLVRSLSRSNVETTLSGLRGFINRSRWLGSTNRYSNDTIAKIKSDSKARRIREPKHLAQYISASCLLHCSDGWSYLGKAILSLLRGDPHRARHLAYYAELRAAVSLLATEGIGIFNNKHFIVDAPDSVARMHGGAESTTHLFAWACLDYWASRRRSGELFADVVKPYGRSLQEWMAPLGGASTVAPQAREWFRQWGMDLKKLPEDREARNNSSYQPDGIPDLWPTNAAETLAFVRQVWSAFEPSSASRFEVIDRHILRIALHSAFKGRTGKSAADDPSQFSSFVAQIIDNQAFPPKVRRQWLNFVTRQIDPIDLEVFRLSQQSPETRHDSELAIVSRAALLLRFATGSISQLLTAASFSGQTIEFWWKHIGQERGLWDGAKTVNELLDLWADISSSLEGIQEFQQQNSPESQTFFRIGSELANAVVAMANCELVAIWSIAPE